MKLAAPLALAAVLLAASLSAVALATPASPQAVPSAADLLLTAAPAGAASCNAAALAFQQAPSPTFTIQRCGSCSATSCIYHSLGDSCPTGVCISAGSCGPSVLCHCSFF